MYKALLKIDLPIESRFLIWGRRFFVHPNRQGFLYCKNQLQTKLEPGIYRFWDFWSELDLVTLPRTTQTVTITNQEVLTKDNISLRFSYFVQYRITDGETFLSQIDVLQTHLDLKEEAQNLVHTFSQCYWRRAISDINSIELNQQRGELFIDIPESLRQELAFYGIELKLMMLRDITFPKVIQNLFARNLESKIRAQSDLENARTTVATARTLKNAAQLMKENEDIKFLYYLETLTRIANLGNHTFVVGNTNSLGASQLK